MAVNLRRRIAGFALVFFLSNQTAFALPTPIPTAYAYDALNRLAAVTSLRGGAAGAPKAISLASYTYDGEGKRLSATEGGVTTTYLYDGLLPIVERQGATAAVNVWGLSYFGARYYSPALARWLTPDSLGKLDGPNLYAYVRNNPINWVDPFGLFGLGVTAGETVTAGAGVAGTAERVAGAEAVQFGTVAWQ